jgi:hypothetical protein
MQLQRLTTAIRDVESELAHLPKNDANTGPFFINEGDRLRSR